MSEKHHAHVGHPHHESVATAFVATACLSAALATNDPALAQANAARNATPSVAIGGAVNQVAAGSESGSATSMQRVGAVSRRGTEGAATVDSAVSKPQHAIEHDSIGASPAARLRPSAGSFASALSRSAAEFRAAGEFAQPLRAPSAGGDGGQPSDSSLSAAGWRPFAGATDGTSSFQQSMQILYAQVAERRRHEDEMKDRQRERRHEAAQREQDRALEREQMDRREEERERDRRFAAEEAARRRTHDSEEAERDHGRRTEIINLEWSWQSRMRKLEACLERTQQEHAAELERQRAEHAAKLDGK